VLHRKTASLLGMLCAQILFYKKKSRLHTTKICERGHGILGGFVPRCGRQQ